MQAWALLMDSYLLLKSRRIFWVTLGISLFVVLLFGSIGFEADGVTLFFGLTRIESTMLYDGSPLASVFYRGLFATFIVGIWLAWIAIVLAIISTSNIFPDFLAGGSIDMVLSKPITRVKVFAVKYLVSLLFVVLQVAIFCVGIFLCMGLRIGDWSWEVFLAIPLITVFYSYLFSVTVLFGVRSKSAVNALLFTLLFWFCLFVMNTTEGVFNRQLHRIDAMVDLSNLVISERQSELDALPWDAEPEERTYLKQAMAQQQVDIDDATTGLDTLVWWHDRILSARAVLPKTADTIGLLRRSLTNEDDINIMDVFSGAVHRGDDGEFVAARIGNLNADASARVRAAKDEESVWFVIGTSVLFELVVLSLACWSFVRRDF